MAECTIAKRRLADQDRQLRYELNRLRFEHDEALTRRRDLTRSFWRWLPSKRMALKLLDYYLQGMEEEIIDITTKIHMLKSEEK